MSYYVTKYPEGTFCWASIVSTDLNLTENFLSAIFGWNTVSVPAEGGGKYTLFQLKGKDIAGGIQRPPEMGEIPSHWQSYVSVDHLEATLSKAQELGAIVMMPPVDSVYGRTASIVDPTGALLNFWQAKEKIGAEMVNDTGAMVWNELHTNDRDAAVAFYRDLFGWELNYNPENQYTDILNKGRRNGGILQIPPEWRKMPSNWAVYFTVQNIDSSLAKVKSHGGQVIGKPKEIPLGRFALIQEPAGAHFLIMELKFEPQNWDE